MPLRGKQEVLYHGLLIYCDLSAACFNSHKCSRPLTFSVAPCPTMVIQFGFSLLTWKSSPEIEQVDPIKPSEVVWILLKGTLQASYS